MDVQGMCLHVYKFQYCNWCSVQTGRVKFRINNVKKSVSPINPQYMAWD